MIEGLYMTHLHEKGRQKARGHRELYYGLRMHGLKILERESVRMQAVRLHVVESLRVLIPLASNN